MMLPQDIGRSVKEYKKHTNQAVSTIYRVTGSKNLPPSSKVRDEASEQNIDASEEQHHMSTANLERRISFLVQLNDNSLQLPFRVSTSLNEAADLRDEVTNFIIKHRSSQSATAADQNVDLKHRWFSSSLRKANGRLQSPGMSRGPGPPSGHINSEGNEHETIKIHKAFSALEVEEPIAILDDFDEKTQIEADFEVPSDALNITAEFIKLLRQEDHKVMAVTSI